MEATGSATEQESSSEIKDPRDDGSQSLTESFEDLSNLELEERVESQPMHHEEIALEQISENKKLVESEDESENSEQPSQHLDNEQTQGPSKFYYKMCCHIKKENEEKCKCGRSINDHDDAIPAPSSEQWNSETDTTKIPSFPRKILFSLNEVTGSQADCARVFQKHRLLISWRRFLQPSLFQNIYQVAFHLYLRISNDALVKDATEYHRQLWPKDCYAEIVVSFLGGCSDACTNGTNSKIKGAIEDGISNILNSFNCALITRGSHLGLAKSIGSVCNEECKNWKYGYFSRCIGVMPWGLVLDRDNLSAKKSESLIHYNPDMRKKGGDLQLDPNHHEFFLVDDGSVHKFGTEISFFSKLQQNFTVEKIPAVSILAGGGLSSLKAMYHLLFPEVDSSSQEVTKVPVVIMKGSGKVADILSNVLLSSTEDHEEIRKQLRTEMERYLDLRDKRAYVRSIKMKEYEDFLFECITKRKDMFFVYDAEEEEEIDLKGIIARAALKGIEDDNHFPPMNKVQLAIEADKEVLVRKFLTTMKKGKVYTLIYDCLKKTNLKRFKELVERYGLDVQGYIKERLHELYYIEDGGNPISSMTEASHKVQSSISKFFRDKKEATIEWNRSEIKLFDIDTALVYLSRAEITSVTHSYGHGIKYNDEVINAMQALLINQCILLQLPTVKLIWLYDHYNPLSNAVIAHTLLSGSLMMNEKTKIFNFTPDEFIETIKYFEDKMVDLLDTYYKTNRDMAKKALTSKIAVWRNNSLVDVAGNLGLKFFIERPSCQQVLEESWRGEDEDRKRELKELKTKAENACCWKMFHWLWFVINDKIGVPKWKFRLHVMMYMISVLAFSYFVLFKKSAVHEPIKWAMLVIVSALTLDEMRQIAAIQKGFCRNFHEWRHSVWNILDVATFLLFFVGLAFSFSFSFTSKVIFAIFLSLSWLKIAQFMRRSSFLGPYMVMILNMLLRMKTFLTVVSISVMAYGVLMTSLLFPDAGLQWKILFTVLFRPFLIFFGDMGLEHYELNASETVFGTKKVRTDSEIIVVAAMAVFLLFANTLLINLLIADFSNIYDNMMAKSNQIWRYEQFTLLKEFKKKPVLPIPFSVFENIYLLCKDGCSRDKATPDHEENRNTDEAVLERRKLAEFERFCFKMLPKEPTDLNC